MTIAAVFGLDLALVALACGLIGLLVFTVALITGLAASAPRRRQRQQLALPVGPSRRVVTGPPARLPASLPPAAPPLPVGRPPDPLPATPARGELAEEHLTAVQEAERTIIELMDQDPHIIVRLISAWLAQDDRRGTPRITP